MITGFGDRPFGEPPRQTQAVTNVVATVGTGPSFSVSYDYSSIDALPALMVRIQVMASNHRKLPSGSLYFFDSGWVTTNVASGSTGTYSIDAVESSVPTDTGAGSADHTLHLVVRVSASYSTIPNISGDWEMGQSASFDIQWGTASLAWVREPSWLVSTPEVTASWAFSSTRGFAEGSWQVQLTSADESVVYYDSYPTAGDATSYVVPFVLVDNTNYRLTIYAWNSEGVPATPLTVLFVSGETQVSAIPQGGPLTRFLDLIGFQLDVSRSMAERLRFMNDPLRCPGVLLPALAQQLGVSYEAEMGMAQTRRLLSSIVHEYKNKGTFPGIAGISTAVTGWPTLVTVGPNKMLSASQLATAAAVTGLTSSKVTTNTGLGGPTQPAAYTGTGWPTVWPTGVTTPPIPPNSARFNASASPVTANLVWDSLAGGAPQANGVPVPPGAAYVSAGTWLWMAGLSAVPSLTFTVRFWDHAGNSVSTSVLTPTGLAQNAWNHLTVPGVAVPAGAVWVSYTYSGSVTYNATDGLTFHAAPQIEFAQTLSSTYTTPRMLQLQLGADRTNYVQNPSFENNATTYWSSSVFTLSVVSGTAYNPPWANTPGNHSLAVTNGTATDVTGTTVTTVPVPYGGLFTASLYLRPGATARPVTLTLTALDVNNNSLGSVISAQPIQETANTWVEAVLATPLGSPFPSNTTQVRISISREYAVGEVSYIDDVMLESGWFGVDQYLKPMARPYFDADIMNGAPSASDYFWANGATKQGPSYYYENYAHKIVRLYDVLVGISRGGTSGTPNTSTPLGSTPSVRGPMGQGNPMIETGFMPAGSSFQLVTPITL